MKKLSYYEKKRWSHSAGLTAELVVPQNEKVASNIHQTWLWPPLLAWKINAKEKFVIIAHLLNHLIIFLTKPWNFWGILHNAP